MSLESIIEQIYQHPAVNGGRAGADSQVLRLDIGNIVPSQLAAAITMEFYNRYKLAQASSESYVVEADFITILDMDVDAGKCDKQVDIAASVLPLPGSNGVRSLVCLPSHTPAIRLKSISELQGFKGIPVPAYIIVKNGVSLHNFPVDDKSLTMEYVADPASLELGDEVSAPETAIQQAIDSTVNFFAPRVKPDEKVNLKAD